LGACGAGALFLWRRDEVLNEQEKKALEKEVKVKN
jgi:hypothetical protein